MFGIHATTPRSIIIAALVFVDPNLLTWLPWSNDSSRIAIGIFAIVTFFLSSLAARVDWKSKFDAHGRAASAFTQVKFRLRARRSEQDDTELERMLSSYEEVARGSIVIPDSDFLRLKSEHFMKIFVSRVLDRYPAAPVRLTKFRLRLRHARRAWRYQNFEE